MTRQFEHEIQTGERFGFGANWALLLRNLTDQQIRHAEESLRSMLFVNDLKGKRFLDIGCGSGLFSLAAERMGARVHSLDFDPQSVRCAQALHDRYCPNDEKWTIEQGSVLDGALMASLGVFDIVYAWGVLHHTGSMWAALENAALPVARQGKLFVSIYNDQGGASRRWRTVKRLYNKWPRPLAFLLACGVLVQQWWRRTAKDCLRLRPFATWRAYSRDRGMTPWRDVVDWVGGYPFEVAKPEQIFDFYRKRGFTLTKLQTCGGSLACNQFVFVRD